MNLKGKGSNRGITFFGHKCEHNNAVVNGDAGKKFPSTMKLPYGLSRDSNKFSACNSAYQILYFPPRHFDNFLKKWHDKILKKKESFQAREIFIVFLFVMYDLAEFGSSR